MRVLQIEGHEPAAQIVERMLQPEGLSVYTAEIGEEGVQLAKLYDYYAIVLELMLPDMSGFEVIRQIRTAKVRAPILVLSNLVSIEHKVHAFQLGADDFIEKPFHKDELIARINAVVRRYKGHATNIIEVGNLVVNLDNKTATVDGAAVRVTSKEYQILELLVLRKGMTLSKEQFLNHLYGGMDEPEVKIIDVFICKLRRKLAKFDGGANIIETIWGRGYTIRDRLPVVDSPPLMAVEQHVAV